MAKKTTNALLKLANKNKPNKKTSTKQTATAPKSNAVASKEEIVVLDEDKVIEKKVDKIVVADDKITEAKKRVEELLDDFTLTIDRTNSKSSTNSEEVDIDDEPDEVSDNRSQKNLEWLSEQIELLSEENERLRYELSDVKGENYKPPTDEVASGVYKLFNELQNNYNSMGFNQQGRSNLIINPREFMVRLIEFFPFLTEIRKFR